MRCTPRPRRFPAATVSRTLHRATLSVLPLLPLTAALFPHTATAQVRRWDNNQIIEGTQGKPIRPFVDYRDLNLNFADFSGPNSALRPSLFSAQFQSARLISARFENADIRNADFSFADLTDAEFNGGFKDNANIRGANLSRTGAVGGGTLLFSSINYRVLRDLTGVNLSGNDLYTTDFSGFNLTSVNFSGAFFNYADFTNATINGANFAQSSAFVSSGSGISSAQLSSTASYQAGNLSKINFNNNALDYSDFTGQDLTSSSFVDATLNGANFTSAQISHADFSSVSGISVLEFSQIAATASYQVGNLTGVSFRGNDFSFFTGPIFDFTGINLSSTDFSSAKLSNTNFAGANIRSARFRNTASTGLATILPTTANFVSNDLSDIDFSENDFSTNAFFQTAFASKNLTTASFASSKLAGVSFAQSDVRHTNFANTTAGGFTESQLTSTVSYQTGNLTGINLSRNDLTGWNLASKDLTSADFTSSTLAGATFTNAEVRHANLAATVALGFTQAQLASTTSFGNFDLTGINLSRNNLAGWNLSQRILASSKFTGSNLTTANLSFTDLRSADLTSANLTGANVTAANLFDARIAFANFSNNPTLTLQQLELTQSFQSRDLRGINLSGNDLSTFYFYNQDMTSANLSGSIVAPAINTPFDNANLTGANLSNITGTHGTSASFFGTTLDYANFTGAILDSAVFFVARLPRARFDFASLRSASFSIGNLLTSASFFGASLRSASFNGAFTSEYMDFTSADLTGADFTDARIVGANFTAAIAPTLQAQIASTSSYKELFLPRVNLSGRSLVGWNLRGQFLNEAVLTGANLSSTDLSLADLRNAVGATFTPSTLTRGTILQNGTLPPFVFNPAEKLNIYGTYGNQTPVVSSGTITGPATGSATIEFFSTFIWDYTSDFQYNPNNLRPLPRLLLDTPAQANSNARTLNEVAVRFASDNARLEVTTVTATLAGRTLLPTVTVFSSFEFSDPLLVNSNNLIDLGTNDAVFRNGDLALLRAFARYHITTRGIVFSDGTTLRGLGTSSSLPNTRIAVLDNIASTGIPFFTSFDGVSVGVTDVLARFTYIGDTNLDGIVNGIDLTNLLEGLSLGLTGWQNGDLNYDNAVNTTDLNLLNSALAANLPPLGSPSDLSSSTGGAVPEPAALCLLLPLALISRRRRDA